jgi:hypothetical protein
MPSSFHLSPTGTPILTIHFTYLALMGLTEQKGSSLGGSQTREWRVACAPFADLERIRLSTEPPWHRSNDVRAVNCSLCLESEAWRQARRDLEEMYARKA